MLRTACVGATSEALATLPASAAAFAVSTRADQYSHAFGLAPLALFRFLHTAPSPAALPPALPPWAHAGEPIARAATPPSSWYTQSTVLQLEKQLVFGRSWLAVAHASQLAAPASYAAGSLLGLEWLVCRDDGGHLRAFHNVCRHHAAILAEGSGTASCFRCPYHGWTYGLDGRLQRASRLKGIEGFRAAEHGLLPLAAEQWGGLVWVRQQPVPQPPPEPGSLSAAASQAERGVAEWLGSRGAAAALGAGIGDELVHVASRCYDLACNWKVFVDNFLDGGYHVSVAHPELAAGLDLPTYRSTMYERLSVQTCQPAAQEGSAADVEPGAAGRQEQLGLRLGRGRAPAYIFVYPNLMLNRYGPWLDTNTVIPLGPDRCKVLFEYFVEAGLARDAGFVQASLAASHRVQEEDVALCESVQRGLASPGYDAGRYAPGVEGPMHHFHSLLHADLTADSLGQQGDPSTQCLPASPALA